MTATAQRRPKNEGLSPLTMVALDWRHGFVWLFFVISYYVTYEPAPADLLFIFLFVIFLPSGLYISIAVTPLILFLSLYNFGGYTSLMQSFDDPFSRQFALVSSYMAVSSCFFAFYVAYDPLTRMRLIKNGLILAAVIATVIASLVYFKVPGFNWAPDYARAVGTFKDPNVYSTFLILPAAFLIQGFLLGEQRHKLISLASLLIITMGVLLALSRGAVINFVASAILLIFLTFVLTPSPWMRSRIVIIAVTGTCLVALLLTILMSFPDFRDLFFDRLTLIKSYDSGEKGRFGKQINSIPVLLERPLGFGPAQFHVWYISDPHNTFLNSFASYGWLGGISYITLVLLTFAVGFKTILYRSPWQNYAIAVYCPFVVTTLQGVQIDTDHWRHFYWMLGFIWGMFAASLTPSYLGRNIKGRSRNRREVADLT